MIKPQIILSRVAQEIYPPKEVLTEITAAVKGITAYLRSRLREEHISAQVFLGGSVAKETLTRKEMYDIDIFVRFSARIPESSYASLLKRILPQDYPATCVHGSRDYYQLTISPQIMVELIPVKAIRKASEAENVTDLSYFHVRYFSSVRPSPTLLRDIMLAKRFCQANECYGAESYIQGFSGYALELLILSYKGFLPFLRAMSRHTKGEKIILDPKKQYASKKLVLLDMNESKRISPIILVDPTAKERNVCASLSEETFARFVSASRRFLRSPSERFFSSQAPTDHQFLTLAKRRKAEFLRITFHTQKQAGDIAGTKLRKFSRHLLSELDHSYLVTRSHFVYEGGQTGTLRLLVKKRLARTYAGPSSEDVPSVKKFLSKHPKATIHKGRYQAQEPIRESAKSFLLAFFKKHKSRLREMDISSVEFTSPSLLPSQTKQQTHGRKNQSSAK